MVQSDIPTTIEVDFLSLVRRADPDFERARHRELAYRFSSGREFYIDPDSAGAYAPHLLNEDGDPLLNENGEALVPDGPRFTKLQGNMGNFRPGQSHIGRQTPE